jgi:5'-phosphate synthase pdxT subunit
VVGKNFCPGKDSPDITSYSPNNAPDSLNKGSDSPEISSTKPLKIGVLALQGNFAKHIKMLKRLGVEAVPVRLPNELEDLDGLVIPGGESTTVGKLMSRYGMDDGIIRRVKEGMSVFGTCMGMILLAQRIEGSDQQRLGLMDITVRRNAFGRQVDSFETDLSIPELGEEPLRAIFIRAPFATEVGNDAKIMAQLEDGRIVMLRQGNCLAAAFHPELTDDIRVHEFFLSMIGKG